MNSFLEIVPIFDNDDFYAVEIKASNGQFAGGATCFTGREEITKLSEALKGFPKHLKDEVDFTTGEKDNSSYFTLKLKCKDSLGHLTMRIKIAHIVVYSTVLQERYISEFDIALTPATVDTFSTELSSFFNPMIDGTKATLYEKT
jgi:hypothetical protein